jgi:hypothetical protein
MVLQAELAKLGVLGASQQLGGGGGRLGGGGGGGACGRRGGRRSEATVAERHRQEARGKEPSVQRELEPCAAAAPAL